MLGKAHQPTASRRRTTRHWACRGERKRRRLGPAAFLAIPIAVLALAAPASAAGSLTGVLDTVAAGTAPTVEQAVSAAAPLTPSPAPAQQTGEVASAPAPSDRAVEQTTGASSTSSAGAVASELSPASTRHDQTTAGAPADRPQSGPRSGTNPNASASTLSRTSGAGDAKGTAIAAPQRRSDPVGRPIHGVVPTANRAAPGAIRPSGLLPAARALVPSRLPVVAGRVLETLPAKIATLRAPLVLALTPPALSEVAALPGLPSLSGLPLLAIPPSLPNLPAFVEAPESGQAPIAVFAAVPPPPQPAPPQPNPLSLPAAAAGDRGVQSRATAPPGAGRPSNMAQAYGATPNGISDAMGAPDRWSSPSSAAGAHGRASAWAAGTTASAYGSSASLETAPGMASSGGASRQPSPAPAPGGASPATGAVAGTSIPILLTLAGLLLLAAPRVRRVLRLLGESWRLSPLALILERPG